jgi:hypothetical protein
MEFASPEDTAHNIGHSLPGKCTAGGYVSVTRLQLASVTNVSERLKV